MNLPGNYRLWEPAEMQSKVRALSAIAYTVFIPPMKHWRGNDFSVGGAKIGISPFHSVPLPPAAGPGGARPPNGMVNFRIKISPLVAL